MKEPTTEAGRNHVAHAHDHASMSPMCACPFGPDELAVETLAIEAGARAEQAPLIEALREALRVATFESHLEHSRHFPEADR